MQRSADCRLGAVSWSEQLNVEKLELEAGSWKLQLPIRISALRSDPAATL